jgi:MFS transporter, PPP family, 3-phenylpropionic acid transporter
MKMTINSRYKVLQGLFWMLFCVGSGFISLYLQGRGLGTAGIGTVTALFGILAALLQPMLGRICDRSNRLTWRSMILMLSVPFLILCVIMPFIPGAWISAVFIGMLMLLANVIMPFVNSAHFYYSQAGENINFGVARGIGSGLYALLALFIGVLAEYFGIEIVPLAGILISGAFIIAISRMPCTAKVVTKVPIENAVQKGFLLRYPAFTLMLLASLLMLASHNIVNTYLLQILQSLGGNSSQLGITMAIQAVVEIPILFSFSKLIKHFRPTSLMLIAAIGYALKATLYAVSSNIPMIYVTQLTQMCSFAIFASASVYYTSERIAKEDQITGQAYMTSMIAAGTVLGSLIGGWVLEFSDMNTMLSVNVIVSIFGVLLAVVSAKKKGFCNRASVD